MRDSFALPDNACGYFYLLSEVTYLVWLSTFNNSIMEGAIDGANMSFSCRIDRIVEEFNAEQLHQVLR